MIINDLPWYRDINNNNSSYQHESNDAGDNGYNPYIHGPSKGEYIKSQIESTIPHALVAPDLIKLESLPMRVIYDFTKRSKNYKLMEEGQFERFEGVERQDSKLGQEDLKKLEIELKKKQKRRIRREARATTHEPLRRGS